MPRLDWPHRSGWRVFDERDPAGGRATAWLFLTHPGPSLLVTIVLVAAAGLLTRHLPSARTAVGLTLLMLPAQLGIGALNDWADVDADRAAKPFKPIVRGAISRNAALTAALAGFVVSLATAAWLGPDVFAAALLAVAAGVSYDLWLKRTPAAVLAWWAGLATVPLLAMVITGSLRGAVAEVPLAGLLALSLHLANGLPDADGDRLAGARTLASELGPGRSRSVIGASLLVAAAAMVLARPALGQDGLAFLAAGLTAVGALVVVLPHAVRRLAFPLLALLAGAATVSWLAALPAAAG